MLVIPPAMLLITLFWRGIWVMATPKIARTQAPLSVVQVTESNEPAEPVTEAEVSRQRFWRVATVIGMLLLIGLARECGEDWARTLR